MSDLRLALLIAATGESIPDTRRNFRRELDADLVEFVVSEGDVPPADDYDYDGVVITGSATSVYWDEPWMQATEEWVAGAHARKLPILGVCFGHQLLAAALGGTVAPMGEGEQSTEGAFELGYREVAPVDAPVLFDGLDDPFTVFVSHGDAVVDLPPGAKVIARNEYGIHGFRVDNAFGVQFHPEYDIDTAAAVARDKESFLGSERIEAVLADVTEANYAKACESKRLFDNFTTFARGLQRPDATPATGND